MSENIKVLLVITMLVLIMLAASSCVAPTPSWMQAEKSDTVTVEVGIPTTTVFPTETITETVDVITKSISIEEVAVATYVSEDDEYAMSSDDNIDSFNVYYDGTMAMMGFVDIPQQVENYYTVAVDLLRNSSLFPNAVSYFYRVDYDAADVKDLRVDLGTVNNWVGKCSFYLSSDMYYEPDAIMLTGDDNPQAGRRLNRFIDSFYTVTGIDKSISEQIMNPVSYAVSQIDEASISLVVSDLSEINANESGLIEQLRKKVFDQDMSFAMIGIFSEFAGYTPLKASNTIWMQWGSLPSASPYKTYQYREILSDGSYGIAYDVPVIAASSSREAELRPFYILCMGKTVALAEYVEFLINQLETRGAECAYLIYANDYVNQDYDMALHTTANITDGIREKGENTFYLMDTADLENRDNRTLHLAVSYEPLSTDPRNGHYTINDFNEALTIYKVLENGQYGETVKTDASVFAKIDSVSPDGKTIAVSIHLPVDSLDQGNYHALLTISLEQPDMNGCDVVFESFFQEAGGSDVFDGGHTPGLESLIDHLNQIQQLRNKANAIGTYAFDLDVRK